MVWRVALRRKRFWGGGEAFITPQASNCAVPLCLLPSSAWWRVQAASFIHRWWLHSRATYHPLTSQLNHTAQCPGANHWQNIAFSYEYVKASTRAQVLCFVLFFLFCSLYISKYFATQYLFLQTPNAAVHFSSHYCCPRRFRKTSAA